MKTILDKFYDDMAFNSRNPLFASQNDTRLGKRIKGGYVKKTATNIDDVFIFEYTFDNGNGYMYNPETKTLHERKVPIPKDFFIHKYLKNASMTLS